ncbi:MBL fold metallo-hydrolase [Fulvivirga sp. M361]|uniref:MBL fold metallo-hydrolase n=1 Tax=Fulvivirga sp. M361 TaxID=2594266 RepID=UPI00117B2637|nr:MBL fold metallo-hydrolase [Fulvivirga sp. M361]TRX53348.1 MBL fold metallo-hydrolase [Fulvivirga sp. M361]
MTNKKVYLKPNVVIEPLVDQWYAWPHLVSPATAAMNITGRHLQIMNSYIQAPHIHAAAVKNPKMLGGPFMDYEGGRLEEVKQLREDTLSKRRQMIEFSEAVKKLDQMLKAHNKGHSLESLYEEVPGLLKGYVELVYDLNHNPSFRFFEPLLYRSRYYDPSAQSIALWITENDERPFCLSTPRLNEPNVLQLNIPFSHEGIDVLSSMKRTAMDFDHIKGLLNITAENEPLFSTLFTEQEPATYEKYTGDKIRMRYMGHACILIETKDVSILVDPLISYYGYHSDVSHFSDIDLPDSIDYILITHNHQDHVLFETLLPLRHKVGKIIIPRTRSGALQDPNLKLMFDHIGFNNVIEIDEMESIDFGDTRITGVPFTGEHCDLDIKTKICYQVKIEEFSLLFVADSRIIEARLYEHIHSIVGDVDVIFLGMECDGAPLTWLYGPLLLEDISREKDGSRRLAGSDCEKGMGLINIFNPKEAYVYAMGQEPWVEFISSVKYTDESNPIVQSNKLLEACAKKGIVAERLYGEKELLYDKSKIELRETMA